MRMIVLVVLFRWLYADAVSAADHLPPPCLMQPAVRSMVIPDSSGFAWLPDDGFNEVCESVPIDGWDRRTAGSLDLFVHTDGPAGSGRFWSVTVGVAASQSPKPSRGVCISTSTVGWRTLQRHSKGPLRWLDDVDDDGIPEVILWDSFPLRDDASMAEYALMAWVYRLVSVDSLVIDWDLSRELARSIEKEYRSSLDSSSVYSSELRTLAADALERFSGGRCSVTDEAR